MGSDKVLTCTFEDAAENSRARREALAVWPGAFAGESFAWIEPPVLNKYTRLGVEMCAARGILRAVGYEVEDGQEVAQPATLPREVKAEMVALSPSRPKKIARHPGAPRTMVKARNWISGWSRSRSRTR